MNQKPAAGKLSLNHYQIVFTLGYLRIFLSLVTKGIPMVIAVATMILSAGSLWNGSSRRTDRIAIALSTGTKRKKGSDSDLAIQSRASIVNVRRPFDTSRAISHVLIDEI